jgi:CRP-like cAMP-binding protein
MRDLPEACVLSIGLSIEYSEASKLMSTQSIADHNALLCGLSKESLRSVSSQWHVLEVKTGAVLHEWGQPIDRLYFPVGAVVSLFSSTPEGGLIETAIVGSEGVVGWPAAIARNGFCFRAVIQVQGSIVEVEEKLFPPILYETGTWRARVGAYMHLFMLQLAQSAICNHRHSVEQRLARWLLATHARSGLAVLPLTHELLSDILGSTRPVVTVAARSLKTAGLIDYQHGVLEITDREGLLHAACSCYEMVHRELAAYLTRYNFKAHPFFGGPGLPAQLPSR